MPDSQIVAAFIAHACVPRTGGHASGSLADANLLLSQYPALASADIFTASILGNDSAVRSLLSADSASATVRGGPHGWNALTYLCFSRYLRLDHNRSPGFVRAAEALLDAGADVNTGWYETADQPTGQPLWESAIYGAAAVARHAGLTRLLLGRGADPNDGETAYHLPEGYDNTVLTIVLQSGKVNDANLACMLARKADWHDVAGMRLVLAHGADPNTSSQRGGTPFHHSILRDNGLPLIQLLLDHGADPVGTRDRAGKSVASLAARRGRADVLACLTQRGICVEFDGVDQLIAACATGDRLAIHRISADNPDQLTQLLNEGGMLLTEFAGNGNLEGVRCLLDLSVSAAASYPHNDRYWDITQGSTALHMAAWRAWPNVVKELISRGASVHARDSKGRTALALAVKACVDSYWTDRRSPESVEALLRAGASPDGIAVPSGYSEVDDLLRDFVTPGGVL